MLGELQEKQKIEENLQEELDALKESSNTEQQNLEKIIDERDSLSSLCDEKDSALQVSILLPLHLTVCRCNELLLLHLLIRYCTFQSALLEKNSLEVRLAKLNDQLSEQNAKRDFPGTNNQVNRKLDLYYL